MATLDDFLRQLPLDSISAKLGADPAQVAAAARSAVPALVKGMQANAEDAAGAASLAQALGQHAVRTTDLDSVDTEEGSKIVSHVFGGSTDQVVNTLGGLGGGTDLITKVLPMLAPLVMGFLAKQATSGSSSKSAPSSKSTSASPVGGLLEKLKGMFGGSKKKSTAAASAAPSIPSADGLGGLLASVLGDSGGDVLGQLGGLLGGGRR